jgi:hypothetical protein
MYVCMYQNTHTHTHLHIYTTCRSLLPPLQNPPPPPPPLVPTVHPLLSTCCPPPTLYNNNINNNNNTKQQYHLYPLSPSVVPLKIFHRHNNQSYTCIFSCFLWVVRHRSFVPSFFNSTDQLLVSGSAIGCLPLLAVLVVLLGLEVGMGMGGQALIKKHKATETSTSCMMMKSAISPSHSLTHQA